MAQSVLIGCLLSTILAFSSAMSVHGGHGYGIIGGELANITELPHQVFFTYESYGLFCGGSIISSQHILTENKKCFSSNSDPEDYKVVAATDDSKIGGEEYAVAAITKHPDGYGFAVVKLAKKIKFSDKAKPIALAGPKYRIKDGAEFIASGWGYHDDAFDISVKLRKVAISKKGDEECKNTLPSINLSQQFCAGGEGKKACFFDEGGPLIAKTRKGNVLVGVTKLGGAGCYESNKNQSSVFTKVSYYNKWIKEVVKQDLQSHK